MNKETGNNFFYKCCVCRHSLTKKKKVCKSMQKKNPRKLMFYVLCMVKISFFFCHHIYLLMYYHINFVQEFLRWKAGKFLVEKYYVHRSMIYEKEFCGWNIKKVWEQQHIKVLKRMLISKVFHFLLIRQMWAYFFGYETKNVEVVFMLCVCVCWCST